MAYAITATIPLPPDELSPNVRVHWAARAKATKSHRFSAFVALSAAKRAANWHAKRPVEIDIEYRCHAKAQGYKPRDVQNAISSLKAALDGLADAGIVGSDAAYWLRIGRVSLLTRASDKRVKALGPGVTLTIREAE